MLAVSPPVAECSVSLVSCIGMSFLKSRDQEEGGGERVREEGREGGGGEGGGGRGRREEAERETD